MKGFTLLEVMIALAIMAGVIVTVLGATNYHLDLMQGEHETTVLTLLARMQVELLEQQGGVAAKSNGSFAPGHPDVLWSAELFPTQLPAIQKLVLKVHRTGDKREVALVRYLLK